MNLSRQFLVNIFSSWYAHIIRIAIAFFFVPYITSILGDSRYGVWVLVFQVISYFTLLDFGGNAALIRFVARYLGEKNFDEINSVLNTANLFYFGIGIISTALIYIFAMNFFDIFKIEQSEFLAEGKFALAILGIFTGFRFAMMPFGGSLPAFQRQDLMNILNIAEELVRATVMIILLAKGQNLVSLAIAVLIISVVRHIVAVLVLKRLYPQIKFSFAGINKETARTMLNYSKTAFGISVGWILIFNSDSILLGLVSSSAAVGVFNPAVQMMYHLRMIVNAIGIPLTPAVSQLEATTDLGTIRNIYLRGLKYTSYLSFLVCTGVFFYAQEFIAMWLPVEFAPAARVMQILAVSGAFFLPQILGNSVLLGLGRHKRLLLVLILEVTTKIFLALLLIQKHGLVGMAIANAVPQLILYTTIYPYFVADVLQIKWQQAMRQVMLWGILATVVTAISAYLMKTLMPPSNWFGLAINIIVVLAANILPAWKLIEDKDRSKLLALFRRN